MACYQKNNHEGVSGISDAIIPSIWYNSIYHNNGGWTDRMLSSLSQRMNEVYLANPDMDNRLIDAYRYLLLRQLRSS